MDKFVKIENVLSSDLCEVLAGAMLLMEKTMTQEEDTQVPGAFWRYGYSANESLLHYLKPWVEEITGVTLRPTYSFARVYRNGQELKKHVDRKECEYSVTITLKDDGTPWPIVMDGVELYLKQGDCCVYKGMEVAHERPVYTGTEHVQVFLHYVLDK